MITIFSVLVVVAYAAISLVVVTIVGKKKNARTAGLVAGAFLLLGTWDVILGRAALWYSCEFRQIVSIPTEKISIAGKYFDRYGRPDLYEIGKHTPFVFKFSTNRVLNWIGLEERIFTIVDTRSNQTIARVLRFGVENGWLERFLNPGMTSCKSDGGNLATLFVREIDSTSSPK